MDVPRPSLTAVSTKSDQLQIRVTRAQKAALKRLAREAGLDLSAYVLRRALPQSRLRFAAILDALADEQGRRAALAALNDLLTALPSAELEDAVQTTPPQSLPAWVRNYVAAMVELAAQRERVLPPAWTRGIEPLDEPRFATPLRGLRAHLLRASPAPFKRRNLFVDASLGDRV